MSESWHNTPEAIAYGELIKSLSEKAAKKESAEIIELFGVRFSGKRDLSTGRIFVPVSPESKKALAELGRVGREMKQRNVEAME